MEKNTNQAVQTQEGLWKDYEQTLTLPLPAMGAEVLEDQTPLKNLKNRLSKNQKGVGNEE